MHLKLHDYSREGVSLGITNYRKIDKPLIEIVSYGPKRRSILTDLTATRLEARSRAVETVSVEQEDGIEKQLVEGGVYEVIAASPKRDTVEVIKLNDDDRGKIVAEIPTETAEEVFELLPDEAQLAESYSEYANSS